MAAPDQRSLKLASLGERSPPTTGGGPRGDRLNTLVAEKVKFDDLGATMAPLFARWEQERTDGETFGDFAARVLVP